MRLFDHQQVPAPGAAAGLEQFMHLAKSRLGAAFDLELRVQHGGNGLGDVAGLEGLSLLISRFHGQHIGTDDDDVALVVLDALFQVFGQGAFAGAALAHHSHKAVVLGAVGERGAHIAHAGGLKNVGRALHVVQERVARQGKVFARFGAQGFVLQ